MDTLQMEACLYAPLLLVWCVLVKSEAGCDGTEFLHPNGTCVACVVCGPGEQLSEDCGFGDGAAGVCVLCEEGRFSADTGVAPCTRCTRCNLLNRLEQTTCSPAGDAQCGRCLPGYYELRSITGEVELPCVPCSSRDTVHKECLLLTPHGSKGDSGVAVPRGDLEEPQERRVKENPFSTVLIGSAAVSSILLLTLLLWIFLAGSETFEQVAEFCPDPEGPLSADGPLSSAPTERTATPTLGSAQTLPRGRGNEVHPTSIVINVTTNIRTSGQKEEGSTQREEHNSCSMEEMEQKLQRIWEMAQGQTIEMLDYDSVQDLSLLLDSADNGDTLRRLARSLGVPPLVIAPLKGFQDLFRYLCTSTYTLLPQLAQAAALLPHPEVVARIHRAVTP